MPGAPHLPTTRDLGGRSTARLAFPVAALVAALAPALVMTSGCGDNHALAGGDAGASLDAIGSLDGGPAQSYSIVVLPDTQYYASSFPDIFAAQIQWIIDNQQAERIAFVLHTGDIVDSDQDPAQWEVASRSLHALDGQVPYVITAGNHDYTTVADRMGMGNQYFPVSGFEPFSWFGGTFEPGHIENSYSLLVAGEGRWLVIALEFGPRDEALVWADAVLKEFPDTPAIVITHAYLAHDSRRYDIANRGSQQFNPHDYVMAGQPGTSINDGEEVWRKVVAPNRNVKLVFSGHDVSGADLPPGTTGRLTSTREDGSVVHQVLANYQTCLGPPCAFSPNNVMANGGNGFLRLLRFSSADQSIVVRTYSPVLNQFLVDAGNQFVLPMN
jgi:hypothetical protein